jgi:hypothetical protein
MFQSRLHRRNQSSGGAAAAKNKTTTTTTPVVNGFSSRIPTSLQHVFLSSNRGHDVDKPPPLQVANRAFRTLWSKTFKGNSGKSTNGAAAAQPKKVELSAKAQEAAMVAAQAGCCVTTAVAVETTEVRTK